MKKLHQKILALNTRTIASLEANQLKGGHPTEEPSEGAQCASDGCGPDKKTRNKNL